MQSHSEKSAPCEWAFTIGGYFHWIVFVEITSSRFSVLTAVDVVTLMRLQVYYADCSQWMCNLSQATQRCVVMVYCSNIFGVFDTSRRSHMFWCHLCAIWVLRINSYFMHRFPRHYGYEFTKLSFTHVH